MRAYKPLTYVTDADWLSDGLTIPKVPGGSSLAELRVPTPETGCGDEAKVRTIERFVK